MTERTRVGIIGAGGIFAERHFPNMAAIEGVEPRVVCNRSPASSEAVARKWGIAHVESDWRKLVLRDDVDAVMIGTWPYMHRELSIAALEAGKHVFCQARMCRDLAEATAMHEAAKRHPHLVSMICPPPTRMPWEPLITRLLGERRLGEVRHVSVICLDASNTATNRVHWREQVEYSGLQMLQVGIWAETLNAWVGPYRTLSATTATPIPRKTGPDGQPYDIRVPQIVAVQGTLASGATATELHSGLTLHEQATHVTIFGERATLRIEPGCSILFGEAGCELLPLDAPPGLLRPWQVERDFFNAVGAARRGEPFSVDPDFTVGLAYMQKVQAIHDSARQGRAVELSRN